MSDDRLSSSYGKLSMQGTFFDRFYEVFLNSHPAIKPMFAQTDFATQKQLLKKTITWLVMNARGSAMAAEKLREVAVIHDKDHVNVRPELYRYWTESLIQVIKEHDPKFDSELETLWRDSIRKGIDVFVAHYDGKDQAAAS